MTRPGPKVDYPEGFKRCGVCKEVKPVAEFYRHGVRGYQGRCKPCQSREAIANHKRRQYGLSKGDTQFLTDQAAGICALCGRARKLHIDHDHNSNEVRALLCATCNVTVGHIENSPQIWSRIPLYLKVYGGTRLPMGVFE